MTKREEIVTEALEWVGTPRVKGGMVKGAGCDCGTLILGVLQNCGVIPVDLETGVFSEDWWAHTSSERYYLAMSRFGVNVLEGRAYRTTKIDPGNVVLVKSAGSRRYNHGGIVVAWPKVIHSVEPMVEITDATQHWLWAFQDVVVFDPVGSK